LLLAVDAAAQAAPRPRVALALGGGGARGGAHIGVLSVLEELRIPVDCIAATSMGALVGGAYAAGVSPAEIQELVRETDWINIFDDTAGRAEINMRRKELEDRYFSGLEFGVTAKGLRYREGAVAGEKLKLFFNRLVRAELGERPIEDLGIPISIIATDIGTGDRVTMRTGELTSAMRASMSVPGLIAPVVREGRKLVDGGLTDNLPVQEARTLCKADVVIAVNVGSPLYKPEEVVGVFTVLGQVVNLLTEQNVAKSRAALGGNDVYLDVELGDIGSTQFTRQLEAAERGREAMRAMSESVRRLALPPAQYAAWREQRQLAKSRTLPVIDEVQVTETRYVNPRKIRRGISQQEGQPLDPQALAKDLVQEYSQGDLQALDYSVLRERDKTILRIAPMEKPWGPDYLRFGLNISTDFRTESQYQLRALYQRTWLNELGGEWLVATQIGSDQNIGTEFYQPFDSRQRSFVRPYASTSLRKRGIYVDGERLATYRIQESRAGFDLGANLGVYGQFRAGWLERRLGSVLDTGPDFFPNVTERIGGPNAVLAIDTYDQPFFPTRGVKLDVTHFDAHRVSSNVEEYSRSEARLGIAGTLGSWTVLGGLEGGYTWKGSLPLGDAFTLGGPRRLSGFATDQLLGNEYAFGRLEGQYRLTLPMPVFGLSLIGGLLAESGRMNKRITETALSGWQTSFGAYLAASTALGPFYIGFADAKNGKGRFYLFIGSP
jgi:NTE family protein